MKILWFRLFLPTLCSGLLLAISLLFSGKLTMGLGLVLIGALLLSCGFSLRLAFQLKPAIDQAGRVLESYSESLSSNEFQRIEKALSLLRSEVDRRQGFLIEQQASVDAILESLVDGIIAVNEQGKILFINRAAREILSIEMESVRGKPLRALVRYEAVQQSVQEAMQTGKVVSAELRTHDFPERQVKLRVAPTFAESRPGLTLLFHDYTELKKLETIRRDFVANVSHELKTPLAAIKGYAETLLMGAIDRAPENRTFLQRINKQADLLNQQIQDLLQLARVESGRESFNFEPINMIKLCREVIALHQDEAASKSVALAIQIPQQKADLCWVWADSEGLRTILSNLISNAIRYTDIAGSDRPGRVVVTVDSDQAQVSVAVNDNGIGIAKEHQQRIFERFFRVDPARSRDQGGTGLGLSIVKHLVLSFQGQLELESKLGKGSTFRVRFPLFKQ
jgi:two-component system phosphate regulon sensor histidine kinase PhoR